MSILDKVKNIFNDSAGAPAADKKEELSLELAAAVIMVNVAYADKDFSSGQRRYIASALEKDFNLPAGEASSVIEKAVSLVGSDTNKWKYVDRINSEYSDAEKEQLVLRVWDIVYSDDRLHKHEDKLIHSLAKMLHLRHKKLIELKIEAMKKREK